MKKYHLWTMGCQMNEADSRHLASQLETVGFSPTSIPEEADLVVLNTCVVRQQAEERIYGRLGSLKTAKAKRPTMTIGLMGCLVGVKEAPSLKKRFPFVDVFMPPSDTNPLMDYLSKHEATEFWQQREEDERIKRDSIQNAIHLLPLAQRGNVVNAYVPIVLGCSHACSFCIIPYRRGRERSRPPGDIIKEVTTLVSQGIREVMLLGQIVDRYGLDISEDLNLAGLLRRIEQIDGLSRIRFLTSHPNWMTEDLIDAVANSRKICPHFEVPIQSGNDQVLTRMRRGYSVEKYYQLVDMIREKIPLATINTDIIVGFPGETELQFMDTRELLSNIKFDKVHISKYSTRPKTVAARKMCDDVPEKEKTRRRNELDRIQKQIMEDKNKTLKGSTVEVLPEEKQKGFWRGRTPYNKIVFFESDQDCLGKIALVKIKRTSAYSLSGELQ